MGFSTRSELGTKTGPGSVAAMLPKISAACPAGIFVAAHALVPETPARRQGDLDRPVKRLRALSPTMISLNSYLPQPAIQAVNSEGVTR